MISLMIFQAILSAKALFTKSAFQLWSLVNQHVTSKFAIRSDFLTTNRALEIVTFVMRSHHMPIQGILIADDLATMGTSASFGRGWVMHVEFMPFQRTFVAYFQPTNITNGLGDDPFLDEMGLEMTPKIGFTESLEITFGASEIHLTQMLLFMNLKLSVVLAVFAAFRANVRLLSIGQILFPLGLFLHLILIN